MLALFAFSTRNVSETRIVAETLWLTTPGSVSYTHLDVYKRQVYALEGAIAVTGSLVQWLRDNLGLIGSAAEVETLAATVSDNGGAYVVPAFSGLSLIHI